MAARGPDRIARRQLRLREHRGLLPLTPYDLGYGRSVAFDHDFIGRAALERHAAEQKRVKVTLVWNPEDVAAAVRSLFEPGIP